MIRATALLPLLLAAPAFADQGYTPMRCLFSPDCAAQADCDTRPFTVEIAPIDHEPGLWLAYDSHALRLHYVTLPEDGIITHFAAGYEDSVMLTLFGDGQAVHSHQYQGPGNAPRSDLAYGHCEVLA